MSYRGSRAIFALALGAGLSACSATQPVKYQGLTSAPMMAPNPSDEDGKTPFLYAAPDTDWRAYSGVLLEPVVVYTGDDRQFSDLSDQDKADLAAYMQAEFATALQPRFRAAAAGPGTLRIRLTLTGVESSTPVLSTLTKISPVGLVVNTIQTARDKQASFSGSITYAVEIYDGASGKLLRAFVTKQYPWAENVAASFGTLDAARSGVRRGADALADEFGTP